MYLLKRFAGPGWDRLNALLEAKVGQIRDHIILIASACLPFPEVLTAMQHPVEVVGTEGLPGSRYFPGASELDELEVLSQEAARSLFGLGEDYEVNIQPHSGTQANQIVANTVLDPGDRVVSLHPTHGGHISHRVLVGRQNQVTHYKITSKGDIDFAEVERIVQEERPKLIIAGASSYPRLIDYDRLGSIARSVDAFLHADISHTALFIMSGHHPSPFPSADFATFNMTKNLRGPNGGVLVYRSRLRRKVGPAIFPETQGGPSAAAMFGKCVALHALQSEDLPDYAGRILATARGFGTALHDRDHTLVTEGTDCHYVMVDLRQVGVTGREAERDLEHHRILVNRNLIPDDPRGPRTTSGIRIGLTCVAQLNYSETDVADLAGIVDDVLRKRETHVSERVGELLDRYHSDLINDANAETT